MSKNKLILPPVQNSQLTHCNIKLSQVELEELSHHQRQICNQLEWLEFDITRLNKIINAIIFSSSFHQDNYMFILKQAISTYYTLRSEFDIALTDDDLCSLLNQASITKLRKQFLKQAIALRKQRWQE